MGNLEEEGEVEGLTVEDPPEGCNCSSSVPDGSQLVDETHSQKVEMEDVRGDVEILLRHD